ncbi:VOC family protein [Microlunatus sp. Y2014]|uniref:VOC family protein n=1 Tax=Microlunatus sp. Y2014 TaxID=3418488 RepID=UPI003DA73D6B
MTCRISHTTVDCRDAYALSRWWQEVLGYQEDPDDPNEPGDEECPIHDPATGHTVLFLDVPDPTPGKNRFHFDLRPRERSRDEEVAWLQQRGATVLADHRGIYGPGSGWVTLVDPEQNQFCVLRSDVELAAADQASAAG